MRTIPMTVVLVAFCVLTAAADDRGGPRVEVFRGGSIKLPDQTKEKIVGWSEGLVRSSNFDTSNSAEVLRERVQAIQQAYRKAVRADHLVVSYDEPVTFKTIAGEVKVVEIVVGLIRPDGFASALFTIDPDGRIVDHAKYSAAKMPDEITPARR